MSYVPTQEAALLAWSGQFLANVQTSPELWGLDIAQISAYSDLHTAFSDLYTLCENDLTRTPVAVFQKKTAKNNLVRGENGIRKLVDQIQAFPGTTDEMRKEIKITIKDEEPTPTPVPDFAPQITVVSVSGRTVSVRMRDPNFPDRKARPEYVAGATIVSCIGDEPAEDMNEWKFQGNTKKMNADITFPLEVPGGSKVWISAFWFNSRLQAGPPAVPQQAILQYAFSQAA